LEIVESKRSFTCRNYEGASKLKKFKTWIWETFVGSIANEQNNSCQELLLQRIHECNDLRQQAIELQQEKNAAVQAVQELITKVSQVEQRERHAVSWARELEKRVEHLEKQCCHERNNRNALEMRLHREIEQTRALITAAVEFNKQVFTWNQAINNIKNNFPKEWDDATTPKTTN
jgi:chromosome segregation ATPase